MRKHLFSGLFAAALLAILFTPLATTAEASEYKIGSLEIEKPWARASAGMARAAGAFMTIENEGQTDDSLVSATTPVAGMVQIHQTKMKNNIMTMTEVHGITIPAGGEVKLKPGSYHIMLMKLAEPLKEGQHFPLTLTFEKAGSINMKVHVMKPGAGGHEHKHKDHMKHMQMQQKAD